MTLTNTVPTIAIYEEFTHSPAELTDALKALVIGPHYELRRFSNSDEKSLCSLGSYDKDTAKEYNWPNRAAGAVVDNGYTKVFIENALLRYFYNPLGDAHVIQAVAPNKVRAADIVWKTANGVNRSTSLKERDVAVGDVIKIAGTDELAAPIEHITTVAGFQYEQISAVVPATATADAANAGSGGEGAAVGTTTGFTGIAITASAATFEPLPYGLVGDTYVITCTEAMTGGAIATAHFKATSASGLDDVADFQVAGSGTAKTFGRFGAKVTMTGTTNIDVGDTVSIAYARTYTEPTVTVSDDTYAGDNDLTYVIRALTADVDTGKNTFSVTTTNGSDSSGPYTVAAGDDLNVGSWGLKVSFDVVACPGSVWYLDVKAAANGACQTILLKNSMPADLANAISSVSSPGDIVGVNAAIDLAVTLYIKKTVELSADYYTQADDSITVDGGAYSTDASWSWMGELVTLPIDDGDLYVEYRALLQTFVDGRSSISDAAVVEDTLGPLCNDNPLALAVYLTCLNAHGVEVGFIGTETDDLEGYNKALTAVKDDFRCYSIAPLTQSITIQDAIKAHTLAQSGPERSRFRTAWLNSESPRNKLVSSLNSNGNTLQSTISVDGNGDYTQLAGVSGQFETDGVKAGDVVRINFTVGGGYDSYVIDRVENEDLITLMSGPSAAVSTATKIEIWHTQTKAEIASDYAAKSQYYNDRRIRHIWPGTVELSDGTPVAGYYA